MKTKGQIAFEAFNFARPDGSLPAGLRNTTAWDNVPENIRGYWELAANAVIKSMDAKIEAATR